MAYVKIKVIFRSIFNPADKGFSAFGIRTLVSAPSKQDFSCLGSVVAVGHVRLVLGTIRFSLQ